MDIILTRQTEQNGLIYELTNSKKLLESQISDLINKTTADENKNREIIQEKNATEEELNKLKLELKLTKVKT